MTDFRVSRRTFLAAGAVAAAGVVRADTRPATESAATTRPVEPVIDIHQHTNYWGRSDAALVHHQKVMGVTHTILLPAGTATNTPSTLMSKANGLQAGAGGVASCMSLARAHPEGYSFAANEVPDLDAAVKTIEGFIKQGAVCIGEQKFNVPCDSREMQAIYEVAQAYGVPVLMHFQYETYNTGFKNFEAMLKKYPKVTFIGHATMFWANIDAKVDERQGYPRGKVTAGGLTDRFMSDYPNLYADMSAGSGLSALTRDEEHAAGFIARHQDQMMYGSDCPDPAGHGPTCTGSQMIAAIRRLSPSRQVERRLLYENAKRVFKLGMPV